jgi:hypothetical protein
VRYTAPRTVPQGRYAAQTWSDLGLQYQAIPDKASFNLGLLDPLGIYRSELRTEDDRHVRTSRYQTRSRTLILSFNYSFGRTPKKASEQRRTEPEQSEKRPLRAP